ncbi:MAG: N-acetyltransferase [Rhodocyclaceae bacterium]|nr:N-acetyltransferase [Rhodocyclaceae bacterium]
MIRVRGATEQDREAVLDVHRHAFPAGECDAVAKLAVGLLAEETSPATINLLAEIRGEVVGHIAFSPVTLSGKSDWLGYILAPLGVKPGHQGGGVGRKLIERGMAQVREKPVDVVFVYGDPAYYERYGFGADAAAGFLPPYRLQYPFGWLAISLLDGGLLEETVRLCVLEPLRDPSLW